MLVNDIFNYTLVLDFENKQMNWQRVTVQLLCQEDVNRFNL